MKYILLVFDGMADIPGPELDGKTPLMVARTPFMDDLASKGLVGKTVNHPDGMYAGSDVCNMSILGYDPARYYCGRGPLEAASVGIPLDRADVAFRCNLITTDGEHILNSSAGHISTEEARPLIDCVAQKLGSRTVQFYPGVSYRHLMVWRDGKDDIHCDEPYRFIGEPVSEHLPRGDGEEKLRSLIWDSVDLLDNHPVNKRRRDEGLPVANMVWFWGQGRVPDLPSFLTKYGKRGSVVAAVDLVRGIGRISGLRVVDVPGATGYVDTNYAGKGEYAFEELREMDFVFVHVEAPDEAGHEKDAEKKIFAIEQCDELVLGTILHRMKRYDDFRILILPDHPTPISTGGHSQEPVPFLLFDSRRHRDNSVPFDERALEDARTFVDDGTQLLPMLFKS
ncbi:MAG: cofactor-independent phosphoglycerate mutase [Armatimonadetes bacterium]|nr:cofactor-independent phosphoglycerate mutase [Armatimonadota bacterium]